MIPLTTQRSAGQRGQWKGPEMLGDSPFPFAIPQTAPLIDVAPITRSFDRTVSHQGDRGTDLLRLLRMRATMKETRLRLFVHCVPRVIPRSGESDSSMLVFPSRTRRNPQTLLPALALRPAEEVVQTTKPAPVHPIRLS